MLGGLWVVRLGFRGVGMREAGGSECLVGILYLGSLAPFLHSRFPYAPPPPMVQPSADCPPSPIPLEGEIFSPQVLVQFHPRQKNPTLTPSGTTRPCPFVHHQYRRCHQNRSRR